MAGFQATWSAESCTKRPDEVREPIQEQGTVQKTHTGAVHCPNRIQHAFSS